MTSMDEFVGKMRQLIDMERHAEIEETKCVSLDHSINQVYLQLQLLRMTDTWTDGTEESNKDVTSIEKSPI